jgi:hypothetical protein
MKRNGQKRDKKYKKQNDRICFSPQLFRIRIKFLTCIFFQKISYGVFELPLLTKGPKRHKKRATKTEEKRYRPTSFSARGAVKKTKQLT